jgi:alpha-D-xyloside xylohydrolase
MQYSSEKPADPISLYVYSGRDASFTLYEDEDTNYRYEQGVYTNIPFHYDESAGTLTIGERSGGFPGMLKERTFRIVRVSRDHPAGPDSGNTRSVTVHYTGRQKIVRLK